MEATQVRSIFKQMRRGGTVPEEIVETCVPMTESQLVGFLSWVTVQSGGDVLKAAGIGNLKCGQLLSYYDLLAKARNFRYTRSLKVGITLGLAAVAAGVVGYKAYYAGRASAFDVIEGVCMQEIERIKAAREEEADA